MTEGHRHREVPATRGSLPVRLLTRPLWHSRNLPRVDASPYPYGPCPAAIGCYYLSALSILHRWTGLTLRFPDNPKENQMNEITPPPEHVEQTLLSMRPGHRAGAGCSCGWHSHTQTFQEHLTAVSGAPR